MSRPGALRRTTPLAAVLLGYLAACGGGPVADSPEADPTPAPEPCRIPIEVEYGETAERTLAGGECHVAELELEAGRYLALEIEQLGIDVATNLVPPGGREPILFDAPVGASRPEVSSFISDDAGVYRLEVCAGDASADPAPYRLHIESPQLPTAAQRALAAAYRSYSRGARFADSGETGEAQDHFARALEGFRAAGTRGQEGWTLYKLGRLAEQSGDQAAAETHYKGSAGIHSELNEIRQEALALTFLGRLLYGQHRLAEALEVHRRSLRAAEDAGDSELILNALANLAYTCEEVGYTLEAIELQKRRQTLARKTGDPALEWDALTRIGKIYLYSGRRAGAFPMLEEALAIARRDGLEEKVIESLEDLGRAYLETEEPSLAVQHFNEALEARRSRRDQGALARTLNNLGRCYRRLGEREKALKAFHEALSIARETGEGTLLEALVELNLATIYLEEGDFERPIGPCRRAHRILRDYNRPGFTTGALRCLARIHRAHGGLERAAQYARAAVEIVETYRTRAALEELRAQFLADQYAYYELYVDILVRLEERHPGAGYAKRAFEVAERSKGRSLVDNLRTAEAEIRGGVDPELAALEAELQGRMSDLERRILRDRAAGIAAESAQNQLRVLKAERELVVGQILSESPGWSALLASEPATLEEIQAELLSDGATQLVSFLLGEERSYAWIVGRESLRVEVLPARPEIEGLGRPAARLLATSHQPQLSLQAQLTAKSLSEALLRPLAPHLTARRLILVKDGVLHYLPFAALPLPAGGTSPALAVMVDRFEIVEVPSASAAVALRQRHAGRPAARRSVAIVADPVFEPDDARLRMRGAPRSPSSERTAASPAELPKRVRSAGLGALTRLTGSAQEALFISELVRGGDFLLATSFDANRELLLKGGLSGFRVLHLAGHGLAYPDLAGLVLSLHDERGRPVDGLVQAYEIYGLRLSADLVVLSACRTSLGQEIRGEGLMGLSRGFLHAGASQVLASLWDVDDAATAELMRRFYGAYLEVGENPSRALRMAQESIRHDPRWAAPHYWAGFVLQGDGS
jgi:CHAT domain-containing protein/tetratricopeptide (TPR) repeat protein